MTDVETRHVDTAEEGLRVDRWFKRHYPSLPFGRLAKLLRTGQIRVDGRRAAPGDRLKAGAAIRIPPLEAREEAHSPRVAADIPDADSRALKEAVIYKDADVIAINKWPGLAVQGGTGTRRHVDAMLDALAEGGERPRLVHRLDKDTSGVLLLARTASAAAHLTKAFRDGNVEKCYWALVVGVPSPRSGEIILPLSKQKGPRGEQMAGDEHGQPARTLYQVVDTAGRKLAWLALSPLTGRTHQLRVHCAALGTPIVGDRKYGGTNALVDGLDKRLHLHARGLRFPCRRGKKATVIAPLPDHMRRSWDFVGFDPEGAEGDFENEALR